MIAGLGTVGATALALAAVSPAASAPIVVSSNSGSLNGRESVTTYTVDSTGDLTPNPVVVTNERPEGVAISPDAKFLYVSILRAPPGSTGTAGQVQAFAIGPAGALTEIAGSPFPAGDTATTGIAITPSGDRVLVTNRGLEGNANDPDGTVGVFERDQTTGALTPVSGSPFSPGIDDPSGIAIAPDGSRAYVVGDAAGGTNFDGRVAVLAIEPTTGTLTPVAGSPFDVGGIQDFPIVVTPDGSRLLIGDVPSANSQISVVDVNQATGALSAVAGSPFPTVARSPIGFALSPDGGRLYSAERIPNPPNGLTEGVSSYAIGANGTLTPVVGSPFLGAGGRAEAVAASPDGQRVYGNENSNPGFVAGYSVQPAGALAALGSSPYPTGDQFAGFFSMAMTPSNTPQPAFGATTVQVGQSTQFDATATTVPGGRATRYDWDFGDGTVVLDGGPTPSHTYGPAGSFTTTLTVTNDCAANAVFNGGVVLTGQTALCNGPRQATTTGTVQVAAPPPDPPLAPFAGDPVCNVVPPRLTRDKDLIRLTKQALVIQQRIDAAALRRLNALNTWLDAGILASDLCASAFGQGAFGGAVTFVGGGPAGDRTTPTPRSFNIVKVDKGRVDFAFNLNQVRINDRISKALFARAVGTVQRLNALTGGNLAPATRLGARELYPGLTNTGVTTPADDATARGLAIPDPSFSGNVTFTAAQLRKSQRRSQRSIILANGVIDAIGQGLTEDHFQKGSFGADRLG